MKGFIYNIIMHKKMLQFIFQYAIIVLLILLSQIVVVILWFTMQNQVWTQISIIHQMSRIQFLGHEINIFNW